ncbi:MAG: PD-(D/E)XK nuclease family protein [Deltaproteobacteria bacterium]|nr:PD-(D/E)XK nuclease family protein [Deltaproteobacteria bacterium]
MLQVVVSTSSQRRLAAAADFLAPLPADAEALLLGASRDAVDDLCRAVAATRPATFGWVRMTPAALAATLAAPRLAELGLSPATSRGMEAVAARATFACRQAGTLGRLAEVSVAPGFARALAGTLRELRLNGVTPAALRALGPEGVDLAALLEALEGQLTECHLADEARTLALAGQALSSLKGAPTGLPLLLLDTPVHSPAHAAFLEALWTRAPRALLTVAQGDDETLARVPAPTALPDNGSTAGLARLRRHLFSTGEVPPAEPADDVTFFSAPGEGRECAEIARRIMTLARAGTPFDDMAVLVRDPALYTAHLETALSRASVPVYFARGTARPDPAGRAFLAILRCAAEGLSAVRFAEYLSLAQVPTPDENGAPPPAVETWVPPREETLPAAARAAERTEPTRRARKRDPRQLDLFGAAVDATRPPPPTAPPVVEHDGTLRAPWRWESLLVEAAVVGGADRWARRLTGLEAEWRLQLAELQRDDADALRAGRLEKDLEQLGHLRRFALPVMTHLGALPASASWGEWLDALFKLAPRVLRQPERTLAVLAELRPMGVLGPVSLSEVLDVLQDPLATMEQEPPARRHGRVFVGPPEGARGRQFAAVFVPGLAERVFPRKPGEDPLLLDAARARLQSVSPSLRLPTQATRALAERLALRLAVGAAGRAVFLSYARIQMPEARPRVPSFYALDVMRATTGRLPDFESLERDAERASGARLAWPAPPDAADALDDAEHDLAVLGPLLHAPPAAQRGRAQYLLRLNEHLARSLRARWARAHERWSSWEGLVKRTPAIAPALDANRLTRRPYSASALQKFAACPYQFLLAAFYRLEPREDSVPLEQVDPLTRGALFHEIQAAVYRRLRDAGALPVRKDALPAALAILDETARAIQESWRDRVCPAIPRVWLDAMTSMRTDLRTWLARVAEDPQWVPRYFELAFGLERRPGHDEASWPEPATLPGGQILRGAIDLVEEHAERRTLRVTDHKTGQNRARAGMVTGGGTFLQPVLYALALEARAGRTVEGSRLFFCTAAGRFEEVHVPAGEFQKQQGVLALETIDRAVERGALPAAPAKDVCTWCDFRPVCGPSEELRIRHKDPSPLTDLTTLRGLP